MEICLEIDIEIYRYIYDRCRFKYILLRKFTPLLRTTKEDMNKWEEIVCPWLGGEYCKFVKFS